MVWRRCAGTNGTGEATIHGAICPSLEQFKARDIPFSNFPSLEITKEVNSMSLAKNTWIRSIRTESLFEFSIWFHRTYNFPIRLVEIVGVLSYLETKNEIEYTPKKECDFCLTSYYLHGCLNTSSLACLACDALESLVLHTTTDEILLIPNCTRSSIKWLDDRWSSHPLVTCLLLVDSKCAVLY